MLMKELEAFKVGIMSTIFAGHPLLCHCPFCSVATAIYPSGIWNIFVETWPVAMNESFGLPQLEVVPESMIAVCW